MRDAVDATGVGGGYRQGLLNAAGGVETAADFLPVVGDVLGLEDAARSYGQGDMVGAGINMLGAVPIIGDAGVKLAKNTRSALRDAGFTEGFFHGTKQDIQDGFKAGYNDGMVFVSPNKEFASNWVGKGKYQERIGEEDFYDMKKADKQAVWDNLTSQYGDFDNWPEEIVDEWLAKQSAIVRQYDASGGAIYPVAVKANNQFDPESNPEIISEFLTRRGQDPLGTTLERGKTDLEVYQEGNYLLFENKEMADFLKDKGYDSLWLREDTTKTGLAKPFSTLAVLDETGVKPVYDFAREADSASSALRGLDMDQGARMQRAEDQGYFPETLYHGTAGNVEAFDPRKYGGLVTKANSAKMGVWMSDDPSVAAGYARMAAEDAPVQRLVDRSNIAERQGNYDLQEQLISEAEALEYGGELIDAGGQNIIPLKARGNLFEVDVDGATMGDLDDSQLFKWSQEAKAQGFDGLKIKNFSDNADYSTYTPATHYLIFDPKNTRSTSAEFDPAKADSADLLSSVGTTSALRGIV